MSPALVRLRALQAAMLRSAEMQRRADAVVPGNDMKHQVTIAQRDRGFDKLLTGGDVRAMGMMVGRWVRHTRNRQRPPLVPVDPVA